MDDMELTDEEMNQLAGNDDEFMDPVEKEIVEKLDLVSQAIVQQVHILAALQQSISALAESVNRPKKTTLVRDPTGRASHSITETV